MDSKQSLPPSTTTALKSEPTAITVIDRVAQRFSETSRQLCALTTAQKSISAATIIRQGMLELRSDKRLQACTPDSVYQAITEAVRCGLEIGGHLGYAYLIPYNNECTLQISSQGEIELVRRSGQLAAIRAVAIRAKDQFDTTCDPPKHTFDIFSTDRGEIVGFYAVAKLTNGGATWEFMNRVEVDGIRDAAPGYKTAKKYNKEKDSPWATNYEEMGKKTVMKRLSKWLPKSITPNASDMAADAEKDVVDCEYREV